MLLSLDKMNSMKLITTCLLAILLSPLFSQKTFTSDPNSAEFVTSDIPLFWECFDQAESDKKAFGVYLEKGSQGVTDFTPYRIESAKNLYKTVQKRKADYEKIREGSYEIASQEEQIRACYKNLKEIYPSAVFPPTYFVIGAFNSGGTSSKNGLIIGVEMQNEIANIPYIVAHELIHFNQKFPEKNTLLSQSINEGAADFIGELISGKQINQSALDYFNANKEELCKEFVTIMNGKEYNGWLYGGKRKEGRPSDLGYSMGYKISKAYYDKAQDKKQAISDILNIESAKDFLQKSGYLSDYMN